MSLMSRGIMSSANLGINTGLFATSSANLNGSTQYFSGVSYPLDATDFTWLGWFKLGSFGGFLVNGYKSNVGDPDGGYRIQSIAGGLIRFTIQSTGGIFIELDTTDTVSLGSWFMIKASFNNTSKVMSLSINDGTPVTDTFNFLVGASLPGFAIGRAATSATAFYDGGISFVGCAKSILSGAKVTEFYNSGDALCFNSLSFNADFDRFNRLANFNSNAGAELDDLAGNGHSVVNNNSILFNETDLTVQCL